MIISSASGQVSTGPTYKFDKAQRSVIEIGNLNPDHEGCFLSKKPIVGTVVARSFDASAMIVKRVVVEQADGARAAINLDLQDIQRVSMFDASWIVPGLQRLLKVGNHVKVTVWLCGAAGRVMMADTISH